MFPEGISGSFAGGIHGNHFNCVTIPSNTLYFIGQLAAWVDVATLLYVHPGGYIILSKVISSPPKVGDTGIIPPEPVSKEDPQRECESSQ